MCGIAGVFVKKSLSKEDFRKYLKAWTLMEARGGDASGIAIYYDNNTLTLSKVPIPSSIHASKFSNLNIPITKIKVSIAHARAATSGTPAINENNHPLYQYLNGKLITLVHNGVITDERERIRDVDTDSLFYYIRAKKEFNDNIVKETLENIGGTMAILLTDGDKFYFYRNFSPLEYVETDNFIIFASERLSTIFDRKEVKDVKPHVLYKIDNGEIQQVAEINSYSHLAYFGGRYFT
jgi:glucosamine 6-phosphate synthetase-like amidotransferase/phosphosugar isomerase protein